MPRFCSELRKLDVQTQAPAVLTDLDLMSVDHILIDLAMPPVPSQMVLMYLVALLAAFAARSDRDSCEAVVIVI
jgi:hypothetical protein